MDNSLVVVLVISVAGMTLLFLALAFFYGLLTLMTKEFRKRVVASDLPVDEGPAALDSAETLRAAAIAVALARAEAEGRAAPAILDQEGESVSSWWALHHQRRLAPNPSRWRTR